MKLSIIIPTVNNLDYLKFTIKSIIQNSFYRHEIIVSDIERCFDKKNLNFFKRHKIKLFLNNDNRGLCSSINNALFLSTSKYLVLSDDDMFFLPKWDFYLIKELNEIQTDFFYLSSTMIEDNKYSLGQKKKINTSQLYRTSIKYNCGNSIKKFNKTKLIKNYKKLKFQNWNGSHHTPCLILKKTFIQIGGMSEEFNPGFGSDPDLCMKLWKYGCRIFKGVSKSRVYHFGSKTTRRNNVIMNNGKYIFFKKWGMTIDFFIKFYLKRGSVFNGPLYLDKNFIFFLNYLICKIRGFFY